MIGFAVLAAYGLMILSTGRSVVLAYTTPLWVVPGAFIFLKERLTPNKVLGVGLGIVGLIILFNPAATDWHSRSEIVGNCALLIGALLWAANILHIRAHRWRSTPLRLAPWEMLIAFFLLAIVTIFISEDLWPRTATTRDLLLLLFSGAFGTALPYWGVAAASKELPAVFTSLGLLCTPVVTLVTASAWLQEPIGGSLTVAAAFVLIGIVASILPSRRRHAEQSQRLEPDGGG
jgi:drug/metabolite transporter (DMT)-like permease